MHREHVAQRHQIIHQREDGLLDLARVARAADQDQFAREVDEDERRGRGTVAGRFGIEERGVEHGELRREVIDAVGRIDEEVAREKALPRVLRHDAHGQAIARVGSDVTIERVDVLAGQILGDAREQRVEDAGFDRLVGFAPVDMRLAARLFDEEFVVRRTARPLAGFDHELTIRAEDRFVLA